MLPKAKDMERALEAVGQLLADAGEHYSIVIVGGAALNLRGVVSRATRDIDIIAFEQGQKLTPPPAPLPPTLSAAIRTVGRDLGLDSDWLNTGPALQWHAGLPRGLRTRITWRQYGGLRVGIAGRRDLIWLKLFAAVDRGGPHLRDLVALNPTDEDLDRAAAWVKTQDANTEEFPTEVDKVVEYVRKHRSTDRA